MGSTPCLSDVEIGADRSCLKTPRHAGYRFLQLLGQAGILAESLARMQSRGRRWKREGTNSAASGRGRVRASSATRRDPSRMDPGGSQRVGRRVVRALETARQFPSNLVNEGRALGPSFSQTFSSASANLIRRKKNVRHGRLACTRVWPGETRKTDCCRQRDFRRHVVCDAFPRAGCIRIP